MVIYNGNSFRSTLSPFKRYAPLSLILMEYSPAISPLSFSNRLPGGIARSVMTLA